MNMLSRSILVAGLALAAQVRAADDANAGILIKMFGEACAASLGRPDDARAYVEKNKLAPVTGPAMLKLMAGEGEAGAAWSARNPATRKNFAVSIRGETQTCAVWAETVDPAQLEAMFRRLVEAVTRPGVTVALEKEDAVPTKTGTGKLLAYRVTNAAAQNHWLFAMIAADKPGSLFAGAPIQAQLFVSPVAAKKAAP